SDFACLETLRCGPQPSDVAAHLERLGRTARHFGISFDENELRRTLDALNTRGVPVLVRIRLTFDGKASVAAEPLPAFPDPITIRLSDERVASGDAMLQYKTSWRPAHE